jgi:hypothetical protein
MELTALHKAGGSFLQVVTVSDQNELYELGLIQATLVVEMGAPCRQWLSGVQPVVQSFQTSFMIEQQRSNQRADVYELSHIV